SWTHQYLGGISKQLDCEPVLVGGVADHVNMLCRLGRTISQSEWVKEVKKSLLGLAQRASTGTARVRMARWLCCFRSQPVEFGSSPGIHREPGGSPPKNQFPG